MKLLDLLNVLHPDTRIRLCRGTTKDPQTLFEGMVKDIPYEVLKDVINLKNPVCGVANVSFGCGYTMNILLGNFSIDSMDF